MKWFGRKAARVSVRPFLLRHGITAAGAGEWPRSYEAQVREAFLANPVAQRAVRLVAEGCASVAIYAGETGGRGPSDTGVQSSNPAASGVSPGHKAERLMRPALLEAMAAQLLLHGNAYVQVISDAEGVPAELFPLRPERVSVEADGAGWPAAYIYKAGETRTRFPVRDGLGRPSIIHVKAMHPLDDHYGLGCLGAAAGAVAIHNAATRWNKALLDNSARPSGALVCDNEDGGALGPEAFERLREELEAHFQGAVNAGRPLLLEGGMKWQAMSLSPAEMDFAELKAASAREIALAFGAPPMLLGLPGDSTYANYREANRALWRLTILPMLARMLGALSAGLSAWWPELKLEADLDQVSALAEDRERLWAQVSGADFLSSDEKREVLGFGPRPPAGDG